MVKITPRVTIAQSSHNSSGDACSDESNDSFKEGASESAKGEKKVPSEQKADYSKLTHGISINLGNVGMSNSCGSTQLPRIAEEKDSPTGTKSDDYSSSKEIGAEKGDKQQSSTCSSSQSGDAEKAQSDERPAASGSKVSQRNEKEETAALQLGAAQTSGQQTTGATTSSQKNLDQRHCQTGERSVAASALPHKAPVAEHKSAGKGNVEAHQEIKKVSKKHKADTGDGAHSSTHESNAGLGRDKKNSN